jgi:Zn-dependent protease
VILFSLTVHEFTHAYLAYRFGDPTARDMGRLTFNPLSHLDLFGVIVMVITRFQFGWAKPVPVNIMNLRNPRRDDIWISAGGPVSNMALAFIGGMIFRVVASTSISVPPALLIILQNLVYINVTLAFFNLIPLFPLDGSHVLRDLLPPRYEETMDHVDRFAPFVLLILLITGGLWFVIGPPVVLFSRLFLG